jgi:hypothetical protein
MEWSHVVSALELSAVIDAARGHTDTHAYPVGRVRSCPGA